jgi:GNAT superfamily N-acetyltransferase
MAVTITEVTNKFALKEFVMFNIRLYKDNPYHVPGLVGDEIMTLSKKKNPAFDFCESIYFLAYKDNRIAGRIAGIINHRANETWNQQYARFGFVDFVNDEEVSSALFKAVEDWAIAKGMKGVQGPLGFTDLDHAGLLVWGFDRLSTMSTSYSFPYYKEHIEKLGYVKDQDWKEFLITVPKEIPEKYLRIAEIVRKKYGLKIKKFKHTREVWPYAGKIFELWNQAYRPLYGFSELSPRQIEYYVKMYIPMLRLDLINLVLDDNNNIVGVAITLPSLSKALKKAKGYLLPLGWIYLLKALYGKNKLVDLYIIGIRPEYQSKGVNALIFNDLITTYNRIGYSHAESNPELETNVKVQSQWESFEREHHKTRRAYIKHL